MGAPARGPSVPEPAGRTDFGCWAEQPGSSAPYRRQLFAVFLLYFL
jgi:hypothetical protein